MYVPKFYRNENVEEMTAFVKRNNFGILLSLDERQRIIGTHIPFVVSTNDKGIVLTAHISKANEQWKSIQANSEVLVIFSGEHAYISSSWYDHNNVPTWNYIAAHLYGTVRILNEVETWSHLQALVDQHEAFEKNPISMESMGEDYVRREMKGLLAFEMQCSEMQSAFKLSQNRDANNIHNVIAALENRGDENAIAIAKAIKKQRNL
nr:FMN-binding negative transcriptional regulator [Chitinophagaceae bacterium]